MHACMHANCQKRHIYPSLFNIHYTKYIPARKIEPKALLIRIVTCVHKRSL